MNSVDPSANWLTQPGSQTSAFLDRQREELAESDAHGGVTVDLAKTRSMVIAVVLQECAARLRLDADAGSRAADIRVAERADELAEDLLRRPGLHPEDEM
jgi:hypothetical protein